MKGGRRRGAHSAGLLLAFVAAVGLGSGLYLVSSPARPAFAGSSYSGSITGTAFRDFNADGIMETTRTTADPAEDVGIPGVVVDAYDSDNDLVGVATTGANGTYTLDFSASASPTIRVEFANPDSSYSLGPEGTATSGTVSGGDQQYVTSGGTANVGYVAPGDYCNADPTIVIPCIQGAYDQSVVGGTSLSSTSLPALFSLSYDTSGDLSADDVAGNTRSALVTHATVAQIGSVWGEATYNLDGGQYALSATFFKRAAELGDNGSGSLGAVYITDLASSTPNGTQWADVPDAGTDPRLGYYHVTSESQMTVAQWQDDTPGYQDADYIGLGGESLSPDETTLYVVNLADSALYAVQVVPPTTPGGPPTAGTITGPITLPTALPGAPACPGAVEPFAVQAEPTAVYVGLTCTAAGTDDTADLAGYVYALDPSDDYSPGTAPVLTIPFSGYGRGDTYSGEGLSAAWNPWTTATTTTQSSTGAADDWASYPQPQLSSISFDAYGNMTVGVKDRNGDQVGAESPAIGTTSPILQGVTGGDLLLACANSSQTWTLESDGSCASGTQGTTLTSSGVGNPGEANVGGVGDELGPGGGEFYFDHYIAGGGSGGSGTASPTATDSHGHTAEGGVVQVPGFADVVTTHFDPVSADIASGSYYRTGGLDLESNQTGADDSAGGGTIVYSGNSSDNENDSSFAKSDGLGDVAVLCSDPPVQIGNRVFIDEHGDGLEDAADPGVAGVTVTLESAGGTVLATTTTDSDGEYLFDDADVPGGLSPSTSYQVAVDKPSDFAYGGALAGYEPTVANASTADPAVNSVGQPSGTAGAVAVAKTPAIGADLDYDFGFVPVPTCAVGDTAFLDANDNGVEDGTETGIGGVSVTLYDAGTGQPVTTTAGGGPLTNPVTTTATGSYLFDDLACGSYYEVFAPAAGYGLTRDLGPSPTTVQSAADPDTGQTADFTLGTGQADNVASADFTPPAGSGITVTADTVDPDEDVGILPPTCAVGDTVFVDTNGNGSQDAGEAGLAGVTVTLYTAGGTEVASTVTDSSGKYLFDGLTCGTYYENFSGAPDGYNLTQQKAPPGAAGPVLSQPDPATGDTPDFTLGAGEADNEASSQYSPPDGLSETAETVDPVEDAGYTPPTCAVGDTVFADDNANGTQDAGEAGLSGVTVTLYDADGDQTTADAQGGALTNPVTTDSRGNYLFDDLACGSYYVAFTPPAGYTPSPTQSPSLTAVESTESDATYDSPVFVLGPDAADNVASGSFTPPTGLTLTAEQVNPTIDAGFVPDTCSVGETTFTDSDGNGTQDGGEPVLPGVTVTLYTAAGQEVTTDADGQSLTNPATTDSDGHYLFADLPCGESYYETFTAPDGYTLTTQAAPSLSAVDSVPSAATGQTPDFTLGAGDTDNEATSVADLPGELSDSSQTVDPGEDAGFRPLCAVGDTVFIDPTGSGVDPGSDPPLAGVTVTLYTAGGTEVSSTVTDSAGHYVFDQIPCGSYYLTFTPPSGIGYAADPETTPSGTTAVVSTPGGDGQTPDFTLGSGDTDNEPTSSFSSPTGISVSAPTIDPVEDAGFVPPTCAVGDTVFVDGNGDGIQDGREPGLAGVTATLYDANGQVVTTGASGATITNPVVTGTNGTYLFEGLACGSYQLTFTPPAGYSPTVTAVPSLSTNDSQINAGGSTPIFVLGDGQTDNEAGSADTVTTVTSDFVDPAEDAGFVQDGTLVGEVYSNQPGTPGVGGATVTVTDPQTAAIVASTTTSSNGGYSIGDLPPGTYTVTITPPSGDTLSTPGQEQVTVPAAQTATFNAEVAPAATGPTTTSTTQPTATGTTSPAPSTTTTVATVPSAVPAGGGRSGVGPAGGRGSGLPFGSWGAFGMWLILLSGGVLLIGAGARPWLAGALAPSGRHRRGRRARP